MATASKVRTSSRRALQQAALIVGATFLLVGVLGFVPGVTTHFHDMTFAGRASDAKLLGVFEVSVLHNFVHLLFGVIGIAASRSPRGSRSFLLGGGVVYLALWIYGLVIDKASAANFVPVNTADNWLHLLLGAGMIGLGLVLADRAGDGLGARRAA